MANTTGKKYGGRKAGTKNLVTQEIKEFMKGFLERKFEVLDEIFDQLEPKDKINAIVKMLPYIMPKQMQMDLNATHTQEVKHDLSKLSDAELHNLLAITEKTNPN